MSSNSSPFTEHTSVKRARKQVTPPYSGPLYDEEARQKALEWERQVNAAVADFDERLLQQQREDDAREQPPEEKDVSMEAFIIRFGLAEPHIQKTAMSMLRSGQLNALCRTSRQWSERCRKWGADIVALRYDREFGAPDIFALSDKENEERHFGGVDLDELPYSDRMKRLEWIEGWRRDLKQPGDKLDFMRSAILAKEIFDESAFPNDINVGLLRAARYNSTVKEIYLKLYMLSIKQLARRYHSMTPEEQEEVDRKILAEPVKSRLITKPKRGVQFNVEQQKRDAMQLRLMKQQQQKQQRLKELEAAK